MINVLYVKEEGNTKLDNQSSRELLTIKGETEGSGGVVGWLIESLLVGINDGETDGSGVIGDEVFEVGLPVVCWLDFIKQSSTIQENLLNKQIM